MRKSWVDNFRAIAILLIVLGHCYFPDGNLLVKYIFSFHVVAFFFLSGYLYNSKKYKNYISFGRDKFRRLIIPYFFFNVIFYLLLIGESYIKGGNYDVSFIYFIKGVLFGSYLIDSPGFNLVNGPMWFLTCLFITSSIFYFFNKYIKYRKLKIFLLVIISILVYLQSIYYPFRLPWNIEISFMMMLFYGFGHLFRNKIDKFVKNIPHLTSYKSKGNKIYLYLFFLIIIILSNIILLEPGLNVNISTNYYGNYFNFIINSFLGIITLLIISKNLPKNKILDYFGKNSIIILGFEGIKIIFIPLIFTLSLGFIQDEQGFLIGFIQFFVTIGFLVPVIYIVNRWFWFFVGGRKKDYLRK